MTEVRRIPRDFRETNYAVHPRKPHHDKRPLLVCTRDLIWSELTGEVRDREQLAHVLITHESSIFVCENAPAILIELNELFGNMPGWQWRVTPVERRKFKAFRTDRPTETRDVIVNYFGFRFPHGQKYRTFYHYPLDTMTFLGGSISKAFPDHADPVRALIDWGTDVRDFARENNLKVSPTTGGLAAQLLRDPRFFPANRRKVPRATNDRARPQLPGNHYELFVPENRTIKGALYLDMTGAHHYAAEQVTFPDPNRLYARGYFRDPPEDVIGRKVWARAHSPLCDSILHTQGLFLVRLQIPHHLQRSQNLFPPPWLRRPSGTRLAYVYSNELPMIEQFGAVLDGVEAAWTSSLTDSGLNRYARWSRTTTDSMKAFRKAWAKPALLSAYGMLAARPRRREFGYREAERGEDHIYMTSGGPLQVKALMTNHEQDSVIANVIARGMIEAQVRMEVLALAAELHSRGCKIIALYADSIILTDDSPLPLLPDHWRVKSTLSHLEFFNPVSFRSDEMIRLPGVPARDVLDKLAVGQRFRAQLLRTKGKRAGNQG